jgi:hypothetical protein
MESPVVHLELTVVKETLNYAAAVALMEVQPVPEEQQEEELQVMAKELSSRFAVAVTLLPVLEESDGFALIADNYLLVAVVVEEGEEAEIET